MACSFHWWVLFLFETFPQTRYNLEGKKKLNTPENISKRHQYEGGGTMVWASVFLNGRTGQHIFTNTTMNAEIYRDEVLYPHVKLLGVKSIIFFLSMDNNERLHRDVLMNDYLEDEGSN
ncbi:hypothetical protein AVEN_228764-1 [Araneus ventricosus]|uniref:Uncharacterized protein n=1 Tax=Araneus ventricosus TaxID=182803 RepID=A0A4Y2KMB9_ARAVE|nr:hypothetical protein AVEN_228764-1 [Araneus ventricosus]